MINAARIIDRAVRSLGLTTDPRVTPEDKIACLREALIDVQMNAGAVLAYVPVTTIADQSEYALDEEIHKIDRVTWPTAWDDSRIRYVTPQFIRTFRQDISADSAVALTTQPEYFTVWQRSDGKFIFAIENAASIAADLTIGIYHFPLPDGEITETTKLIIPDTQMPMLRYCLTWKLAEQWQPQREREMHGKYLDARLEWKGQMTFPTNEPIHRPIQPF